MNTIINITENIFAVIGGLLGWLLGGCDSLIYTLIAFVVFDYISGLLLAIFNRTLSSEVGFAPIPDLMDTKTIVIMERQRGHTHVTKGRKAQPATAVR